MDKEKSLGLYFHIPFCSGKCPYCDFYSVTPQEEMLENYTDALIRELVVWREHSSAAMPVDTIYFGGGTPVLLGANRLGRVLEAVFSTFRMETKAEITVEANPSAVSASLFRDLRISGFNRLSMGLQSADDRELCALGRKHTAASAARSVNWARSGGFDNISLDLMLAVQGQTKESLCRSIQFCVDAGVEHVSAYLLKVEEGTPLSQQVKSRQIYLPGEEEQRFLYLQACEYLEQAGYCQYEISNFSKSGYESRHNLRYWDDREYLGLGASAHSFFEGKRFYYPRSVDAFLKGCPPVQDGRGGDYEEYAMLRLRLINGLQDTESLRRYGHGIPLEYRRRAKKYETAGLLYCDDNGIRLTREGFLVSNALIGEILF